MLLFLLFERWIIDGFQVIFFIGKMGIYVVTENRYGFFKDPNRIGRADVPVHSVEGFQKGFVLLVKSLIIDREVIFPFEKFHCLFPSKGVWLWGCLPCELETPLPD